MSATITTGRGAVVPAVTIRFASGATRLVARSLVEDDRHLPIKVLGLSDEGRIVINYYPDNDDGGWRFGLTTCCLASDTGTEDSVVCRGCYGTKPNADVGEYGAVAVDPYLGVLGDLNLAGNS